MRRGWLGLVVLGWSLACASGPTLTGEGAAAIANEIRANPGQQAEILNRHGLDDQAWTRELYRIARDPEAARAYSAALKR